MWFTVPALMRTCYVNTHSCFGPEMKPIVGLGHPGKIANYVSAFLYYLHNCTVRHSSTLMEGALGLDLQIIAI